MKCQTLLFFSVWELLTYNYIPHFLYFIWKIQEKVGASCMSVKRDEGTKLSDEVLCYVQNVLTISQNCLFVCVKVLRPSQPNKVMLNMVSLPKHTFTGQAKSFLWLTSIVHILSPETDNCPSSISGRE